MCRCCVRLHSSARAGSAGIWCLTVGLFPPPSAFHSPVSVGAEDGTSEDGIGDTYTHTKAANKSAFADSRRGVGRGDISKGSRRPASAKPPVPPEVKSSDMKNAVKSAAAALGHPI